MAHTIVDHVGNSTTPTVTGTVGTYVIGPPIKGGLKTQGLFIWQSGSGSSKTMRWLEDQPITGASPAGYTAV